MRIVVKRGNSEPSVSTPSTSHKNNLMRAARWRMAAEIFTGMKFKNKDKFSTRRPRMQVSVPPSYF
jgi:hypothetical protein